MSAPQNSASLALRREVPNHPPCPTPEVEHAITGPDDVAALLEELSHGGHVLIAVPAR